MSDSWSGLGGEDSMSPRPATVVLDNEAVQALADEQHPKHTAAPAVLEVTNQRRSA